jgi:hypothetical protein
MFHVLSGIKSLYAPVAAPACRIADFGPKTRDFPLRAANRRGFDPEFIENADVSRVFLDAIVTPL